MKERASWLAVTLLLTLIISLCSSITTARGISRSDPNEFLLLFRMILGRQSNRDFPSKDQPIERVIRFKTTFYYGNKNDQREFWCDRRTGKLIEHQAGRWVLPPDQAYLRVKLSRLESAPTRSTEVLNQLITF